MHERDDTNPESAQRPAAPYGVLAVSLLISLAICFYVAGTTRLAEREQFAKLVGQSRAAIDTRLQTYIATLRAGAALFSASDSVSRAEFHRFAESLDLQAHYPGIQGIGYTHRIHPAQKDAFVASVRATGRPAFHIWPDDARDEYHAILYLEPMDRRNSAAIGFDMFTDAARRAAMERARDTGEPAASARVVLVQEIDATKQPGFLIYVPVYHQGITPDTIEARRAALAGFVYAPFRAGDLFHGIFGSLAEDGGVGFRIYDNPEDRSPERRLHDAPHSGARTPRHTLVETFYAAGRPWSIEFFSRPELEEQAPWSLVVMVGTAGLALSFVLFWLMRSQEFARMAAERTSTELRASETALRRSEERFRRLFDADLVGIAFCTLDGLVIDANGTCIRMTGYTRDQYLARAVRWDRATPPEYAPLDRVAVEQVRAVGTCTPYEKEIIRADGTRLPVLIGAAALEGGNGEFVTLLIDLTERKRYEQAMREARDAAETASRLKDEFLATVSHELRTPLNAILGWTDLLRENPLLPADVRHALETIERNARSQAQLIEDLLDVSRIITGKLQLSVQPSEIPPIIDASIEAVRPAALARGVQLLRQFESDLPRVLADPMRLQQAMWNLLHNAIKFTDRGGTVTITAAAHNRHLLVRIADTGNGIDPNFLPHVFERFRQADASSTRRHGGLGLGLTIVRQLVEAHGGTVSADSAGVGQGATFDILLPALDPSADYTLDMSPAAGSCDAVLQGVRVLVVDDDIDACELLMRILTARGAQVVTVNTVAQAIEQLDASTFDILLADISMPEQDGYDLIARVRARESGPPLPAIAVTAQARAQDRERALAAGYQLHVPKPVRTEDLCKAIAALVRTPAPDQA